MKTINTNGEILVDIPDATLNTDTDVSGNPWVLDEDDMASDDDTKVPTQQSVKKYVDDNAGGGTFLELTDTPADYTDDEGKFVVVNDTPNALEFVNHNVALSSTIHPNTTLCRVYLGTANQENIRDGGNCRIEYDASDFDLGSNFKTDYVFNQTQADADSDATHIQDDDAAFTTVTGQTDGLKYALVTWSSDEGGTTNVGSGYVTAVTDADTLTIYKTSGDNFGGSYYYTIKECWYKVPTTGYYLLIGGCRYLTTNLVADENYQFVFVVNGVNAQFFNLHCATASRTLTLSQAAILYLTADDLVIGCAWHTAGVDTIQVAKATTLTYFSAMMLQQA